MRDEQIGVSVVILFIFMLPSMVHFGIWADKKLRSRLLLSENLILSGSLSAHILHITWLAWTAKLNVMLWFDLLFTSRTVLMFLAVFGAGTLILVSTTLRSRRKSTPSQGKAE